MISAWCCGLHGRAAWSSRHSVNRRRENPTEAAPVGTST